MVLQRLHPSETKAGRGFNLQPGGEAAIVAECENATPGTLIMMGSRLLSTTYGSENIVSAIVPRQAYAQPGIAAVYLLNDLGKSNTLEFEIR